MKFFVTFLFALTTAAVAFGAHGHINAGATDSNSSGGINAGDRLFLYFEAGTTNTALVYGTGTTNAADGYSWNGYTTLTALHQSSAPAQAPNYNSLGALSGSFLVLDLVSLSGPTGAKFAFYDTGGTDPLWVYQIGTGFLLGDGRISLTEQAWFEGSPEDGIPSDPYGHIHGRTFATDTAGDFTATWMLRDTQSATTGLLDSAEIASTFSAAAVPEPATWALLMLAAAGWWVRKRINGC
jgi:hypothetical protein